MLPRQFRATPWTEGDWDHAASTVVDHDAVGLAAWPVVDETIGAIISIRMLIARRVDVARHHIAAVGIHPRLIARLADVCNREVSCL